MGAVMHTSVGNVPVSATDVFTATSALGSSISLIQITNNIISNRTVTVSISADSGASYYNIATSIVVPPSTAVGILTGTLNLTYNSRIKMIDSTSGASATDCHYTISCFNYS